MLAGDSPGAYRGSSVPVTDTGRALQPIGLHGLTAVDPASAGLRRNHEFRDR